MNQAHLRESQKIQVFLLVVKELRKQVHMTFLIVVKHHLRSETGLTTEFSIRWSPGFTFGAPGIWKVISVEMTVLKWHINATYIIMHSFLFTILFSKNLLSENKSKVCLLSLNNTCSYRSRWEHKGRNNSFQAEMSETSFKLKKGKRNSIWDTIWETSSTPCYQEKIFNQSS